jgi:hypothetical protein
MNTAIKIKMEEICLSEKNVLCHHQAGQGSVIKIMCAFFFPNKIKQNKTNNYTNTKSKKKAPSLSTTLIKRTKLVVKNEIINRFHLREKKI